MNLLIIFGSKYLYLGAVAFCIIAFLLLPKEKKRAAAFFGIIDLSLTYIVGLLAGFLYYNPRPFVSEHITPLISHAADNGFPSDHTLLVAALASIVYCYNRTIGFVVFTLALLIGASRVVAGIHHWIDIVGAVAIAILTTAIVYKFSRKYLYV